MNKICLTLGIIGLLSILQSESPAKDQIKTESEAGNQNETYYMQLRSPVFMERYQALEFFSRLSKEEIGEKAMNEIINLLIKERELLNKHYESGVSADKLPKEYAYLAGGEEFGIYLSFLCQIVGKSNDEKVLPLLFDYCFSPNVLINFGERAVDSVINILKISENATQKANAIRTLGHFLEDKKEGYIAAGEKREKIKRALMDCALFEEYFFLRSSAVRALGKSGDEDVIPALEKIAQTDPYCFETTAVEGIDEGVTPGEKVIRYPVRLAAKRALQKLRRQE